MKRLGIILIPLSCALVISLRTSWDSIDSGVTNSTSVSCDTNFTNVASSEGSNIWTVYANESTTGSENSTSVTFVKETGTNITVCRSLSQTNTEYILQDNIIGVTSDCLIVGANNITINFAGYNITGDDDSIDSGVKINDYNFTIIKNGKIYDFGNAISLTNSYNTNVTNMTLASSDFGIWSSFSSNNTFSLNNITGSANNGIKILEGSNNTLSENDF